MRIVDRNAVRQMTESGAQLVEVLGRSEYERQHLPRAVNIPLSELDARAGEIPRDRRIVAVCRSGSRSAVATRALRKAGHEVDNLSGGLRAWQRAGLPLEPPGGGVA